MKKIFSYLIILSVFLMPLINMIYGRLTWLNLFKYSSLEILKVVSFFIFIYLIIEVFIKKDKYSNKYLLNLFKSNYLFLFITLLYICSFFSFILSGDRYTSFYGDIYCNEGFIAYTIYYLLFIFTFLIHNKKTIINTLELLVLGGSILNIFHFFDSKLLLKFLMYINDSLTFQNINHYGYYCVLVILVCIYLIIVDKNQKRVKFRVIELFLLINGLMESRSSGPLYSVMLVVVVLNFLVFFKEKKYYKKLLIIDIELILVIMFFNTSTWKLMPDVLKISTDLNLIVTNGINIESDELDTIGSSRGVLWRYGIKMMFEKPLFGYGPDNLDIPFNGTLRNMRPHNTFIQIGASLGIPGLIFYLSALILHLKAFIINLSKRSFEDYGLFMVVLGYLISSFFGNTEVYTTPLFIIILVYSYTLIHKNYN